jgi:hypothetical protein
MFVDGEESNRNFASFLHDTNTVTRRVATTTWNFFSHIDLSALDEWTVVFGSLDFSFLAQLFHAATHTHPNRLAPVTGDSASLL